MNVSVVRSNSSGNYSYLNQNFSLTADGKWHQYSLNTVTINETSLNGSGNNYAAVTFTVAAGNEVLLDNEQFGETGGLAANTSVYRDEVYNTLLALKPGVLRYMGDDNNAGNSFDSLIAPDGQRPFSTPSTHGSGQGSGYISYSLDEFLHLCALVGAEPWFTVPATFTSSDMVNMAEYLAGSSSTTYGAKRAAMGQINPWTTVFPVIHLEMGNEMWNYGFASGMQDQSSDAVSGQAQYGQHADTLFAAIKTAPDWNVKYFDLVKSGWNTAQVTGNPGSPDSGAGAYWISVQKAPSGKEQANHFSAAPYLLGSLQDCSSNNAVFQTAFAEGYLWDQPTPNAGLECGLGTEFSGACNGIEIYEVNFGTTSSACTQAQTINATASIGSAVAVGSHMLQMQHNDGIEVQSIFALPEYENGCGSVYCPLWGIALDFGGQTSSRLRPTGLAMQIINGAISGMTEEITTTQSGIGTFSSAASKNDGMPAVSGIPLVESHAYSDGNGNYSEILINKSLTSAITVNLAGVAPAGSFSGQELTSTNITDNNETSNVVALKTFSGTTPKVTIPPFSIVTFKW